MRRSNRSAARGAAWRMPGPCLCAEAAHSQGALSLQGARSSAAVRRAGPAINGLCFIIFIYASAPSPRWQWRQHGPLEGASCGGPPADYKCRGGRVLADGPPASRSGGSQQWLGRPAGLLEYLAVPNQALPAPAAGSREHAMLAPGWHALRTLGTTRSARGGWAQERGCSLPCTARCLPSVVLGG